jgi:polyhydroxybutyrate depolymerase
MFTTGLLLTAVLGAPPPNPLTAGTHEIPLRSTDLDRRYFVHVPPMPPPAEGWPVVLVFHGGGSNPRQTMLYTGLNRVADRHGFLAVYPDGTGRLESVRTFNAGICCGYAQLHRIDDVQFTRDLLDDLARRTTVDARRVFATGISNGGMMAYRLASELSDRIAAIAPIAGTIGSGDIKAQRPVSVLHFHGTQDEYVNFTGGFGPRSTLKVAFTSVESTVQRWVAHNGCPTTPRVETLPDVVDDGMTVTRKTYGPGRDGAEVVLYVIEGGGHTWPGRIGTGPAERVLGPSTRDIDANELMWEFFQRHPLP